MRLLFLDLDGVANGHNRHPGSVYNGIDPTAMFWLNKIVAATDCKLVISSAWRYQILCGATTTRGFEFLLFSHGLVAPMGTVIGHTPSDEAFPGRGQQIKAFLYSLLPQVVQSWVVLDDAPDGLCFRGVEHRLVKTQGAVGLTHADAERTIAMLLEN